MTWATRTDPRTLLSGENDKDIVVLSECNVEIADEWTGWRWWAIVVDEYNTHRSSGERVL